MDLILELKEEFSLVALILGFFYTVIKGIFIIKIKQLWGHLKRRKVVYGVFIGSVSTLFFIYSFFTVKTQVNLIQSKFDKYENLKKSVSSGKVMIEYDMLLTTLEKKSINEFLKLEKSMSQINFLQKDKWFSTHLTNIFGVVFVDKENKQVLFEYKSVIGKNKESDKIYNTGDYIKDNPDLFSNYLVLQGNDKEAFLNGSAKECADRPLKKNLKTMESEFKKGYYNYNVCDFRESFFYTTGRVSGHRQKTFNEINHIYYIMTPYASDGENLLYFYFAFNSDNDALFSGYKVHASLTSFLKEINMYKKQTKLYEKPMNFEGKMERSK